MKHRLKAKIDVNQNDIVKGLRKHPGISVSLNHDDILVGYRGSTYWFEIKDPEHVSKKTGKIRPSCIQKSQHELLESWRGHYSIVWSLDQILVEIGLC